jgi:hypothetical protein
MRFERRRTEAKPTILISLLLRAMNHPGVGFQLALARGKSWPRRERSFVGQLQEDHSIAAMTSA